MRDRIPKIDVKRQDNNYVESTETTYTWSDSNTWSSAIKTWSGPINLQNLDKPHIK